MNKLITQSNTNSSLLVDILPLFLFRFGSENTRINYSKSIQDFLTYLQELDINITDLVEITELHLELWQRHLESKSYAKTSIHAKLSAMCSLLSYAYKRKLLIQDIGIYIKKPSIYRVRGKTHALPLFEMQRVLKCLRHNTRRNTNPKAWLEYVLWATMCTVGMRATEICKLRIRDLDVLTNRLTLVLKGGDIHSPKIPEALTRILVTYIGLFRFDVADSETLFTLTGKHLYRTNVSKYISDICKRYKLDGKYSAHSCRAGVATMLHKKGVPVGQIQDLLGHRNINTTLQYMRDDNDNAACKTELFK